MKRKTVLGIILTSLLIGSLGLMFNVVLVEAQVLTPWWNFTFMPYNYRQMFCSSPAVADLGINNVGGEPNSDLEIVTGTDEFWGAQSWHCFDSIGAQEWVLPTGVDQSRTSVAIADIDGDGDLEIAGGTTSGWQLQVFDNTGSFVWTYSPWYYDFWLASPAICDVNPNEPGLEVIAATTYGMWGIGGEVFCFNGITGAVLWRYQCTSWVVSSPACGDVDNDGVVEVVIADWAGRVYCLNGLTGAWERDYWTTLPCYSSPALVNVDDDPNLEVIIGGGGATMVGSGAPINITGSYIVCYDGGTANIQWGEWSAQTAILFAGGWIVSSSAVGDVDGDGGYEVVVGSLNGCIYCLNAATGGYEWSYLTTPFWPFISSPALANRGGSGLGIYIGCTDGNLYLLNGTGTLLSTFNTGIGMCRLITSSPAVADIDGDSKLEVMFTAYSAIGFTSTFWVLKDSNSTCTSHAIEWQMFRHDPCRTGTYPKATTLAYKSDLARVGAASSKTDIHHAETELVHDVAITSLVPSKILTVAGEVINLTVGVENQGNYTETFDVSVSYDENIIETSNVTLDAGANTTITFHWNTSDVAVGLYILTAKAEVVTSENETEDNTFNGIMPVRNPSNDIATAYVTPSQTIVGQGYNAKINVTLINQGDYTETFNVTAYANTTEIGKKAITLTSENSTTIPFTWDTTGFAKGNYIISAVADTVPGENDTLDNTKTADSKCVCASDSVKPEASEHKQLQGYDVRHKESNGGKTDTGRDIGA